MPYGVIDIGLNEGFVSVWISVDTKAKYLYIIFDGGESDVRRNQLWKKCLEDFATETGLEIRVSHFPPGTSKWNKIEHRLFSCISKNVRGRLLETIEIIVSLIASTDTDGGLKVRCETDENRYEKGIKVSDEELAEINLEKDEWHGE